MSVSQSVETKTIRKPSRLEKTLLLMTTTSLISAN